MKAGVKEGAAATSKQPENHGAKAKRRRPMSPETKAKIAASKKARAAGKKAATAAIKTEQLKANTVTPPAPAELSSVPAEVGPKPAAGHLPNGAPAQAGPAPDLKPESTVPQQGDAAGQDDAEIAARKERIRELWAENQAIQPRNKKNRFELGKELDELHESRAHHGNGSYDKDVAALGIPKPTAWRIRNYYRELAGLAPVPQFVSVETNQTAGTAASGPTASAAGSTGAETVGARPSGARKSAADILRDRAKQKKRITQVRLEPARHEIFRQALKKCAVALGTESDSETIFRIVTTYEVLPCAK